MPESRFSCPHCQAQLRIRDRKFLGMKIHCPDCSGMIQIEWNEAREFIGVKVESAPTMPARPMRKAKAVPPPIPEAVPATIPAPAAATPVSGISAPRRTERVRHGLGAFFMNPMVFAWMVAGVVTAGILIAIWPEPRPKSLLSSPTDPLLDTQDNSHGPEENAPPPPHPDNPLKARLVKLGEELKAFELTEHRFPQGAFYVDGVPTEDRFSWMAELVTRRNPDGPQLNPNLAWHSSGNEKFVRRSQPDYLNPNILELTGERGYPATHFVGVAGVGEDGPILAATHPRAGVFGLNRSTTLDQIKDGSSNTMLVAGVQDQLGSWAAAGSSTIRPFTREPYINGPDGFGTGSPESMLVLMADGSVRTIFKDTAPSIVRRMAAMSDGLPLDAEVPGEPGQLPVPSENSEEQPPVVAERPELPEEPAVEVAIAPQPPVKKIDAERALSQRLSRFELIEPRPVRELFLQMEEMAGVPIRLSEDIPPQELDRKLAFTLENTSVGGIFRELLKRAGLSYQILDEAIEVRPGEEMPASAVRDDQEPPS